VPPNSKEPQRCANYGIASVFTPAHNRGKGYASHMMRLLHWALAPRSALDGSLFPEEWGKPPSRPVYGTSSAFSVLYTDVGEAFYRNCGSTPNSTGWQVVSPIDTVFNIQNLHSQLVPSDPDDIEWLFESEAVQVWDTDSQQMMQDLSQEASPSHRLCVLPQGGTAAYLNRRVTGVSPSNLSQQQMTWGVRITDASGTLAFATWCPEPMAPTSTIITITRLRASVETFPAIFNALCHYSKSREPRYERLEIWNLPKELQSLASSLGGSTITRKEHLSALRLYGPMDSNNIEWVNNERYCWC